MIAALLLSTLLTGPWRGVPAEGVEMKVTQSAASEPIRVDFDFHGRGGYAITRIDRPLELPDNFELAFRMKADAPRNTLEVKFVQGENVWWTTRRELDFPKEWRRFSIKKRQLEFAWGPIGPSPLPKTIDAIEIVVTAGTGGKGTIWLDDVKVAPLETADGPPPPYVVPVNGVADLGARYEIGGVVVEGATELATSIDGRQWESHAVGNAKWIPLPDTDARYLRVGKPVRVLPPIRNDNEFFALVARDSRRGDYPRYLHGEQLYWTIVGGDHGEEAEALLSEDGAVEVPFARVSIEPFLEIDGKRVSWNDVELAQEEGPRVVWKKHLTITPTVVEGQIRVRYQAAPNAKLMLAVRPFQVNPPWQFLNRTGGVVRISELALDGSTVRVTGDREASILFSAPPTLGPKLPEAGVAGDYKSALLAFDSNEVTLTLAAPASSRPDRRLPAGAPFSLDLPAEPRIAKTIAAQLEYILINKDGPAIHPGSRSYERSWIRDGSLTSAALLRLGRHEVVRDFIEYYAKHLRADGYVPCCVGAAGADPVPEHDAHGQFIYLIADYYRHTHDRALLEAQWPNVVRVMSFIETLRAQRMTGQYEGTEFYGLVPESISHEGYSAKPMHSYWDDFFILRGLNDAAFLARELNRSEASRYAQLANDFRQTLVASIAMTMQKHGIDYIPGSAELGDFDATSTTVAISPVDEGAALPRNALLRTFDKYYEHALEPRTYTPYELRVVGTLVRLGQAERARNVLAYFFEDQRPRAWYQWAEVVHRNPREPQFLGDMPHTWVGSDFIRSALDFLAYESGDALVVAAGISRDWAKQGVRVRNLGTYYGNLDYSIEPDGDALRVRIGGALRVPKDGIRLISPLDGRTTVITHVPAEIILKEGS
ncbi:MAG TPA: coagulation factor 5/8 type domain-containing protein [Thermoanaerobaculia bacterium]|nr:coagulation factor 5/8 type domain-containing protein [Thermoanaerobaculia bacterium]